MGRSEKKKKKKQDRRKSMGWRTASNSDVNELYELSVQEPEAEVDLVDQVWQEQRGRTAYHIREDFCGTAIAAIEWVKRRPENTAVGVDLDPDVLDWARERLGDRLDDDQRSRLRLLEGDAMTMRTDPVDSILAMNFSYYLFRERAMLRDYFAFAREGLVDDGLFLLDAYGGSDSFLEMEEDRHLDGFTYIWDQAYYNPITGAATNHIHFKFPDGSRIDNAFTYEWRLWTLPEIQEILLEAGFEDVVVYWEGTEEDGDEGNGEFTATNEGEACPGWIAYVVAKK